MKRHAVLLTILFALVVSIVSVSVVFWEFYKLNKKQYIEHMFTRYALITQIYREYEQNPSSVATLEANLAVYDLELVRDVSKIQKIIRNAKVLKRETIKTYNEAVLFREGGYYTKRFVEDLKVSMLKHASKIYFYIQTPVGVILIKDNKLQPYSSRKYLP